MNYLSLIGSLVQPVSGVHLAPYCFAEHAIAMRSRNSGKLMRCPVPSQDGQLSRWIPGRQEQGPRVGTLGVFILSGVKVCAIGLLEAIGHARKESTQLATFDVMDAGQGAVANEYRPL